MKFGIDMGHNAPPDTGASSKFGKEDDLTKQVGTLVSSQLQALGHEVVNCNPTSASSVMDSLRQRVQKANSARVDLYVSIHFNAYNNSANGTEVYAVSDAGRRIAQPVLENIIALGFTNRGVKDGSHLYVVKNTSMAGILIECCFIDSEKDMKLFNTTAMANAIVKGLTGKLPTEEKPKEDNLVLELQQALNRLQIRDAQSKALVEDGKISPATEAATLKFHEIMGVNLGNRATALTWNLLDEILALPTLRPNHAQGAAVRYVQFRFSTTIDGDYGAKTAEAAKVYQRQQNLDVDGLVGQTTWGRLTGASQSNLVLKVLKDTILKQQPLPSDDIKDDNLKQPIPAGSELTLYSWEEQGNHIKVSLRDRTFKGFNIWYVFTEHIAIWQDGKPLEIEADDEKPQVNDRANAFNLPGFASIFYLNNPIVPNGHFYWRDALQNGERIPKTKAEVDSIIALATRLEQVRDRLGGFPLVVTSWYRPEPWNSQAGGAPNSRHKVGQAVDILRSGMSGKQMAAVLEDWPGGMGIYEHYPNLLHLDIRPFRARWGGA
ncbi:N-acetylmuramoyl-L-alanine amidase [Oscillatoria sp. FACHB-1406]|uniref:N-acetylmuramoyl-L-alanine amidase n=1 Tax=Oscillatoria sp. FACHB-1406 TaxID=2692846 RepID=UPI001683509D|nr:N-acetylmuramoyl-L-alanine amidase [Oscillatoria sp. FACHB-1406]MBD2576743.1 N-acetylmuramoyl-L-alanine amidase [Oscillatoria sp. FACHB-1406]